MGDATPWACLGSTKRTCFNAAPRPRHFSHSTTTFRLSRRVLQSSAPSAMSGSWGGRPHRRQHTSIQRNLHYVNPTQLNSTQLGSTQLSSTQPNSAQLNQTRLNSAQLSSAQLNPTQLSSTQLNSTQPNSTQPNPTQPNSTQPGRFVSTPACSIALLHSIP